ncbi:MAG: Rpn family recombination-promoting nuclease/putative transposase [Chlamydiae bacterium]|nr:Rpn family recombination-promoting nuclease/putative transposase [Chlamydiota bacterium]
MLTKYLDPTNDVAFKTIFGTEKNKDILIHFLNDILVFRSNQPIVEVEFLKTIQDPVIAAQKTSIVDILCKDEQGSRYIVEMQVARTMGFEKRAQYYASKTYCSQAEVGDKYPDLKEVVFIAIADFTMFPDKKRYKSDHVILDRESHEHDLKDFSFTFIELPKFKKTIDELSSVEEKWCYFFKHAQETSPEELDKIIGKDVIIQKAYKELDRFHWSTQELQSYEESEKRINDYLSSLGQKFIEGKVEGKIEGKAEGLAEGARKKQIEMAEKMLQKKRPLKEVVEFTDLELEEVKKIQAALNKPSAKLKRSVKSKKRVKKT